MKDIIKPPDIQHVLFIHHPTTIHPRWERFITGFPIESLNFDQLPTFQKILTWKSYKQYERANPREIGYIVELAINFLQLHAPTAKADLWVAPELNHTIPDIYYQVFRKVWTKCPLDHCWSEIQNHHYDTIIFLYPDSIGLGWQSIEHRFRSLRNARVYVLNGRRRFFRWDKKIQHELDWRRFLETAWFVEVAFIPIIILAALFLSVYDGIKRPK